MSDALAHNFRTTFDFYLHKQFPSEHGFSFEEVSTLNLEILTQAITSERPLSTEEAQFLHVIKNLPLYLKRPSFMAPEKYHQGLIVSYDLFAYPALEAYLNALKTSQNVSELHTEYRQLWRSPQVVHHTLALAEELAEYLKKIEPLPASFYKDLPLKKSGYNAYIDAPILENGQFVFFRLTPDSHRTSSSNMGDQFLIFSDAYLDDFAVAYLADQIDPLIRRRFDVPLAKGDTLRRTTERIRGSELHSIDTSEKLAELNSSSASYSACYQSSHSKHCFFHNTVNEIFHGSDIRQAIGLRLILELRQLNSEGIAGDFVSKMLSKRSLDEDLQSFMTGILYIQALYPAFYPIQSARYVGVLEEGP